MHVFFVAGIQDMKNTDLLMKNFKEDQEKMQTIPDKKHEVHRLQRNYFNLIFQKVFCILVAGKIVVL